MRGLALLLRLACLALPVVLVASEPPPSQDEAYLTWSAAQVEAVGTNAYRRGRVGGIFNTRLLKTERAYNYKLAATWMTPDVIRATARMIQLRSRLSNDETRARVQEAEATPGTVVMVEIDPREGSGVIPTDWEAFLEPKGAPDRVLRGTIAPQLRDVKALAGVLRRNYDYDRFWVTFPLEKDGRPSFTAADTAVELVVRIHGREGRVDWPIPASLTAAVR